MGNILYYIIIRPAELLIELVFLLLYRLFGSAGSALPAVSLVVSLLTLPLYLRADRIQEEDRQRMQSMDPYVRHIKSVFQGTERSMILNTFYRQRNYTPLQSLRSTFSLLLQIPFFIAAYRYLSDVPFLKEAPFLMIRDLGAPDGLLAAGGMQINMLPILMTLLNVLAGAVYTRGAPLREKLQTYGLALLFLLLLYRSPAGLVLYWTCNQLFSLVKNLVIRFVPDTGKFMAVLSALTGILVFAYLLLSGHLPRLTYLLAALLLLLLSFVPLFLLWQKRKGTRTTQDTTEKKKSLLPAFAGCGLCLTLLTGVLIPSALIGSEPQEFIQVYFFRNPMYYIWITFLTCAGIFLFWGGIVYYISTVRVRSRLTALYWCLTGVFIVNYMFFGRELGVISANLVFDEAPFYSYPEKIVNLLILVGVILLLVLLFRKLKGILLPAAVVLSLAIMVLSGMNLVTIGQEVRVSSLHPDENLYDENGEILKILPLSKNKKNVIVFMLDRAIGYYIPFLMQEKPELVRQFDGFVHYPNTVSFGTFTVLGAPPLFGGYEYTVEAMNRRDTMTIPEKHNESLKVMPVLFLENGYDVTVCDPPFAGYQWIPDLSIYDDYPEIETHITDGALTDTVTGTYAADSDEHFGRNLFFYNFFKVSPLFLQPSLYDEGDYLAARVEARYPGLFLSAYSVLTNLPALTEALPEEGDKPQFLMLQNTAPHEPAFLQLPEYEPAPRIDNTDYPYDALMTLPDGRFIRMWDNGQIMHYQVNMATMLQLGKWFDYLRENDLYDNTRIILVSDHGRGLWQMPELFVGTDWDAGRVAALLMVKDFGATGPLQTSHEFMTVADTPLLATDGIIDHPVNPFTGNPMNDHEKTSHPQRINSSEHWQLGWHENSTTFDLSDGEWYTVQDDIWVRENWVREE